MNSARRLVPAIFLLISSGASLRAADDSFRAPDSLVLKGGTVVRGLIIKNTRDSVLIQEKFMVLELFVVAAIYYLLMTTVWDFIQRRIERHYGRAYGNASTGAPVVPDAVVLEQR